MPEDEELPSTSNEYLEFETAKAHGGWPAWQSLPPYMREKLMAHELHKSQRDAYFRERAMEYAKRDKKDAGGMGWDPLVAMKARFGMK